MTRKQGETPPSITPVGPLKSERLVKGLAKNTKTVCDHCGRCTLWEGGFTKRRPTVQCMKCDRWVCFNCCQTGGIRHNYAICKQCHYLDLYGDLP